MANLLRIREVTIYATLDEHAAEAHQVKELLKTHNVPVINLFWGEPEEAARNFEPLSSWSWTVDGETHTQRTFDRFPIVTWKNVFDNDVIGLNNAVGLEELQNSQLIANLDKVVRPS